MTLQDRYHEILAQFIKNLHKAESQACEQSNMGRDLTFTESHVLYQLKQYHTAQPMNVLAQHLEITQPSLTNLIDRLEEKGYVRRTRNDEKDRRVIFLELTPPGHQMNKAHTKHHHSLLQRISAALSPEESQYLFSSIEKVNRVFSQKKCTLDQLKEGESARVIEIDLGKETKSKLMEMGLIKGVTVKLLKIAPLGDPLQIQVRDSLLSIRNSEASHIYISHREVIIQ